MTLDALVRQIAAEEAQRVAAPLVAALETITTRQDAAHEELLGHRVRLDALEAGTAPTPAPPASSLPAIVNPLVFEPLVSAPMPAYRASHDCTHQSGTTKITRVTDTPGLRNRYSSLPAFSANGRYLMLTRGGVAIIDLEDDYRVIHSGGSALSMGWWTASDPERAVGLTGARTLQELRITPTGISTIHTHVPQRPSGGSYASVNFGGGQGTGSNDDRWWSFMFTVGNQWGIGVYDMTQRKTVAERILGTGAQRIDCCGMAQSGDWLMYAIKDDGSGSGTGVQHGMWILSRDLATMVQAETKQEHWDWGRLGSGDDLVWWKAAGIRAKSPTGPVRTIGPSFGGSTHVSCRSTQRPGLALISRSATGGTAPGSNQLYTVALDGSGCRVYGFLHRTTSPGYEHDAMATLSPDGSMVAFGGRWENNGNTYGFVAGGLA